MIDDLARYGTLLLSGSLLTGKAVFLHRYFHNGRAVMLTGHATDMVLYHAGVTIIAIGITVGQVYALTAGGFRLNPALSIVIAGLILLDVAVFRIVAHLGPLADDGGGGEAPDAGILPGGTEED